MRELMADMSEPKAKKSGAKSIIFRIIIIVIAGLVVGTSVFSWNAQRLVGNMLPMPFGFGASVVLSPSMEPVLHTNDLVFVAEQDAYHEGDIVVYQDGNMLIIHRIIAIDEDQVITQGDANNIADDPFSPSQIKGKMTFRIPYIGFVIKFIKTVPGTLLILLAAVFLMYRSRQKEKIKGNAELEQILLEIKNLREQQLAAQSDSDTADNAEGSPVSQDVSLPPAASDTASEDSSDS